MRTNVCLDNIVILLGESQGKLSLDVREKALIVLNECLMTDEHLERYRQSLEKNSKFSRGDKISTNILEDISKRDLEELSDELLIQLLLNFSSLQELFHRCRDQHFEDIGYC